MLVHLLPFHMDSVELSNTESCGLIETSWSSGPAHKEIFLGLLEIVQSISSDLCGNL